MSQVAETTQAATDQDLTAGFESLDRRDARRPSAGGGQAPRLAAGLAGPHRAGEVGGRQPDHEATGSTASRCCTASASRTARSPTRTASCRPRHIARAQEKGEIVYSEFATDPCRSLFARAMSIFSPKLTDNANVNLVKLGERYISDDRDADRRRVRRRHPGNGGSRLQGPGDADHRPPPPRSRGAAGCSTTRPSSVRAIATRFYLLRPGDAKPQVTAELPGHASPPTCTRSGSLSAGSSSPSSHSW